MDSPVVAVKDNKLLKGAFAVDGIMVTLVIYGVLQEKLMRVPYGQNKEFFTFSLFLVFCNRLTTSAVSAASLVIWGSTIMEKRYKGLDYLWAILVTVGCSLFILYPAGDDISPYKKGRESTVWGMSLMAG